jgi:hypothetical protein
MNDKDKIRLLCKFIAYLHDRGLASDPEVWDFEAYAFEFLSGELIEGKEKP